MYIRNILISGLAAASTAQAYGNYTIREEINDVPHTAAVKTPKRLVGKILGLVGDILGLGKGEGEACPAVWSEISATLTEQFLGDGECTDAARAAIRGSFHDCFNGACDGSLILANECSNFENRGLERLCGNLGNVASQTKVGVADLIQFAAAHAIKTCPGGPTVPFKIGRKDSNQANALGVLPGPNVDGEVLVKRFAEKGFSSHDLAALIGAHTAAKQRVSDPAQAGKSMDSTVGTWDNTYYKETKSGKAPFTLQSDKNIMNHRSTRASFTTFSVSKGLWDSAFVSAMTKMSMLGVNEKNMIDCTSALPGGSRKREIRSSNLFERLRW